MSESGQDASIPLLTEVIAEPDDARMTDDIPELPLSSALPVSATPSEAQPAPLQTSSTPPPSSSEPINTWLESEWTRLEQKISERTLVRLQQQLDPLLEQHIRASLNASLDQAMDAIRTQLQSSLAHLVREAVAEEIRHLDFANKKEI